MNSQPRQSIEEIYPQPIGRKIIIDPQKLMRLKKQRQPLKMVKSKFEPQSDEMPENNNPSSPAKQQLTFQNNTNISIVSSLVPIEFNQLLRYEEAEDIPIDDYQILWMIIMGEVRVTVRNGKTFDIGQGFVFPRSDAMRKKILQVTSLRNTVLLKLSRHSFNKDIQPYFSARCEEIISTLAQSNYVRWSLDMIKDVASIFQTKKYEKGEQIYQKSEEAQFIYIVKEGVVLLERTEKLASDAEMFFEYEKQHEMNSYNDSENTLIVRKGMLFGVDGTILRHGYGRIYQAKTMSPCEVYFIKAEIFQTLTQDDILIDDQAKYASTNSIMLIPATQSVFQRPSRHSIMTDTRKSTRQRSDRRIMKREVKPISLSLKYSYSVDLQKKHRIQEIHKYEEKVKLNSIKSPARSKISKMKPQEIFMEMAVEAEKILRQEEAKKIEILPKLKPIEKYIQKAVEAENEAHRRLDFMSFKERVNQRLMKEGIENSQTNICLNVKSYRNINSGLKVRRSQRKLQNPQNIVLTAPK